MTVIDTSIFIDALFRFDENRSSKAKRIFEILQQRGIALEPEIFKIELIGQLVRRVRKEEAMAIYEEISKEVKFVEFAVLNEVVLDVL